MRPSMCLVVPYFGTRPGYLPLVLRSMAANPDVTWLFMTDAPLPGAPANVRVELTSFAAFADRIRRHFDFPVCIDDPYKACDYRPAFGEIFASELAGFDFWGHSDVDVLFGRIRDELPDAAFEADKVLVQGNFALYRNTPETAAWYRHEVGGASYRRAFTTPRAAHFDEWDGIWPIVQALGVPVWNEYRIFDLSFARYRTRALLGDGGDPGNYPRRPRRYAWEDGEVCEYSLADGEVVRRTALLVHFQKRTMRPPSDAVLAAPRFWLEPNGFAVQHGPVTPRDVRAARWAFGPELIGLYRRRAARAVRRRRLRRAAARG